ncbi:hypothetical protein [uncultured Stenotrophomonas sp.]|nr:hypothetical protein [uncultured Stenotrophomonas sp.]
MLSATWAGCESSDTWLLPVAVLLPGVGFGGALLGGALLLGYVLRRRRNA